MQLLEELERRNVIRVAGLYLVAAWLLTQVASTVFPAFDVPAWALRALIIALVLGFVPALILSWVFELTPQGLMRDEDVKSEKSIAPRADGTSSGAYPVDASFRAQSARRMDRLIIVVLICALVYFTVDKFVLAPRRDTAVPPASPAPTAATGKSIAVLAFTDLSPAHDQDYFSDGMAEEILNALAKIKDLKVAGRTSSFYYKGKNEDLRTIGKALGVANVLEGSVRKQGDRVRITAQLIRSDDGFHLWSDTYDGELTDVFELQERIARAITGKLEVILQGGQQQRLIPVATRNPEAYALYLQATGTFNRRDGKHMADAIAQLNEAIRLDPQYARAYSRLAALHAVSPIYMGAAVAPAFDAAEQQWQAAMNLDSGLAESYAVLGYVRAEQRRHLESDQGFKRALALDPDDVTANFWHALVLLRWGYTKQGDAALDRVLAIDPLLPNGLLWRSVEYVYAGDQVNAERLARRSEEVGLPSAGWTLSALAEARGQKPEAIRYLTAMWRFISPGYPAGDPEVFVQGIFGDASARARALAQIDRYLAGKPASLDCTVVLALIRLGEPARALTLAQDQLTANDGVWMTLLWSPDGRAARATPQFQTFIHGFGLVELWDQYGPPDICHKADHGDYLCE